MYQKKGYVRKEQCLLSVPEGVEGWRVNGVRSPSRDGGRA